MTTGYSTKTQIHAVFRIVQLVAQLCQRLRLQKLHRRQAKATVKHYLKTSKSKEWRQIRKLAHGTPEDSKILFKRLNQTELGQALHVAVKKVSTTVNHVDYMGTARDDAKFIKYKERPSQAESLPSLWQKICAVNVALAIIEEMNRKGNLDMDDLKQYCGLDEKALANLEYLLRHTRWRLVHINLCQLVRGMTKRGLHGKTSNLLKFGGEKWCSEFASGKRPLSTTWPWNIRPSLAVLWGVCWMFIDYRGDYIQNAEIPCSSRSRRSQPGGLTVATRASTWSCPTQLPHHPQPPDPGPLHQSHTLFRQHLHPNTLLPQPQPHPTSVAHSSHARLLAGHFEPSIGLPVEGNAPYSPATTYNLLNYDSVARYNSALIQPDPPISPIPNYASQPFYTTMSESMADEDLVTTALAAHNVTDHEPSVRSLVEDTIEHGDSLEPFSPRRGHTHKRAEEPPKNDAGKMMCKFQSTCAGVTFDRKCEWSKHMDKHERPYKCEQTGCEKLQGFTYSGGLLRHQREVHKMHGGTKEPLFCPFENCKRNAGSGFTRKENLHEHVRRVHRRATDGLDLSTASKRPFDSMDSTTDPLLRGSEGPHVEEVVVDENIDPNMDSPIASNPNKRRRIVQTNGTSMAEPISVENTTDMKAQISRLMESNRFLTQQNQDIRSELSAVTNRLNKLENEFAQRLLGD